MPSSRASSSVATEVATQRISQAALRERGQQMGDGRTGPEADQHPVLDQLRGGLGGALFSASCESLMPGI